MKQRKIKAHRRSIQKAQHLSTRHSIRKIQRELKRKGEQRKEKVTKKKIQHFQMEKSPNVKKTE